MSQKGRFSKIRSQFGLYQLSIIVLENVHKRLANKVNYITVVALKFIVNSGWEAAEQKKQWRF